MNTLGLDDLVWAGANAWRFRSAASRLRDHHRVRYDALRSELGLSLDPLFESFPRFADGTTPPMWLTALCRTSIRSISKVPDPFGAFIESPRAMNEIYDRHKDRLSAVGQALKEELATLARETLELLSPGIEERTTTAERLRHLGVPNRAPNEQEEDPYDPFTTDGPSLKAAPREVLLPATIEELREGKGGHNMDPNDAPAVDPAAPAASHANGEPTIHVFEERNDEEGFYRRWVTLHQDGRLTIEGHDIGAGVEAAFGHSEYEFIRTVPPDAVEALRAALGLPDSATLVDAVGARFRTSSELEQFLDQRSISSSFWNRIGD